MSFLDRLLSLGLLQAVLASPALATGEDPFVDAVEASCAKQDVVGMAVSLIEEGRVTRTIHFGWADREGEVPVTDETRFRWASISKTLTAVVALQLEAEGELDLDRDVREYVPEFPEKPFTITARQLLCHQGGIVHYSNGPVIPTRREYDVEHPFADVILALDDFKESPLVAEPGTGCNYSTRGYMLLGAICQRTGGERYVSLVEQRIAEPLALESLEPDYQWLDLPHRAVGYRRSSSKEMVRSMDTDVSWKLPGGGFLSNVRDLGEYGAGLLGNELLTAEQKARAWTAQRTRDGKVTRYGLGFRIMRTKPLVVGHTGSQEKSRTYLRIVPTERVGVAIMCNTEGTKLSGLSEELIELLLSPEEDGT